MDKFWNQIFWNNTMEDWIIAIGIIVFSMLVIRILRLVVLKRLQKYSAKTKNTIDDFIIMITKSTVLPLLYVLAFYLGLKYIVLPENVDKVLQIAILVVITFFVLKAISAFISYVFIQASSSHQPNEQREKQARGIILIIQVFIWLLGILFLINNMGYNVTTLIAGLGIGGIAIALAAQTILGDLFSYLVIFFDRPFEIGDFIVLQDKKGVVEYIGIKTTRLRALGGEQLICSNTDLTNSRVHNYKRMLERRIVFSFGVVYQTPAAKLKDIPARVKAIIESEETTRFDRAHFLGFGDFSLNFEVVYFVLAPEYNTYMDRQQAINLKIYEDFENSGIEFAYPTQTLFFNKVSDTEVPANNAIRHESSNP